MQINWSPVRRDEALTVTKQGDALTTNGEVFDFTTLLNGETLPRDAIVCDWLASDVERVDGEIILTLILPHGANAPEETRFPQPVVMAGDGPVPVPPHSIVKEAEEEPQEEQAE